MSLSPPKRPRHQEKWNVEFKSDDNELIHYEERNNLMVVLAIVTSFKVKRILVNSGSAMKFLSWETYKKMGLKKQSLSKPSPLYSFVNHLVEVKGTITLPVTLGDDKHTTTECIQFYVVDLPMAYNTIFGKPIMRMTKMVMATFYMNIKFLTSTGISFF